jgi:hypothetical protein
MSDIQILKSEEFDDETKTEKISNLSVQNLLALQREISIVFAEAKKHQLILEKALEQKFRGTANKLLAETGKETGTVRFIKDDYIVTAKLPKKVVWEQNKLAEMALQIPEEKRHKYLKVSYGVDERQYKIWPSEIKQFFSEARTVKISKPKFLIKEN